MALLGYWPPAAHLALVAACAATAWWRLETAAVVPPGAAMPGGLIEPAPVPETEAADTGASDRQDDVQAVSTRALFRPGRVIAADEEIAVATVVDPVSLASFLALRMVGYVEQGGRQSAILETVEDGQSHVVHVGDEIGGGLVRQISPRAVVVETNGRWIAVELYPD